MSGVKMPFLSPPSSPPVSLYLLPLPPFSTGSILKKAPSALDGGGGGGRRDFLSLLFFPLPAAIPLRPEGGRKVERENEPGRRRGGKIGQSFVRVNFLPLLWGLQ